MDQQNNKRNDLIIGRNPVMEAVKSGRAIESILVARGNRTGTIPVILAKAKEKGIVIKEVDSKKLDYMCAMGVHQGIAAVASVKEYSTVEEILQTAQDRGEPPFIIILDELEDPHNLGAIIRTAECAGAHGVIISQRRSAGLTYAVGKSMEAGADINIYTPLQVYRKLGGLYSCIGVMAANNISSHAIEEAFMASNQDIYVVGTGSMPVVRAIEDDMPPADIVKNLGLADMASYMKACGAEAIVLGCTHFPYFKDELAACTDLPLIDPAEEMYKALI